MVYLEDRAPAGDVHGRPQSSLSSSPVEEETSGIGCLCFNQVTAVMHVASRVPDGETVMWSTHQIDDESKGPCRSCSLFVGVGDGGGEGAREAEGEGGVLEVEPNAADDSVELRSISTNIAGAAVCAWCFDSRTSRALVFTAAATAVSGASPRERSTRRAASARSSQAMQAADLVPRSLGDDVLGASSLMAAAARWAWCAWPPSQRRRSAV
uniref:Uncharacterized protein n=1 Tax=Oryza glumipatula TaxID=40148 RepID=A0A0E0AB87_9ORYZ